MYVEAGPLALTRRWLEEVIIAKSFCPFARLPYEEEDVLLELLPLSAEGQIRAFAQRAQQMSENELPETALLISSLNQEDFELFLDFQDACQQLVDAHFPQEFVIASFHPLYRFADMPATDMRHFIHRSPLPIVQLLRNKSISAAKKTLNREELLARNAHLAASLGPDFFVAYLYEGGQSSSAAPQPNET